MLRVYVFRLMGVISRLGCGEGLRDCKCGGGRGRWCAIHADHRIVGHCFGTWLGIDLVLCIFLGDRFF